MTALSPEQALEKMFGHLGSEASADVSAAEMISGTPTADEWDRFYLATQSPRFLELGRTVERLFPGGPGRILDVGPAIQTEMLRLMYPDATIDTLGWPSELTTEREGERHVDYDLDHASVRDSWPDLGEPYDLVVLEEVIEHLNVRPLTLLELLAGYLVLGGRLIVETPNSAYLAHRIRSLLGRHPYGRAHDMTGASVPLHDFHGHFRVYLLEELVALGEAAGLVVESSDYRNDYAYQHAKGKLVARLLRYLPARFHMQLRVVFRKP